MVWAQVKGYIASKNTTYKMADVEKLAHDAFEQVTSGQWTNYCQHVKEEEQKMWDILGLQDTLIDRIVIELGNESDSSDYDSEDSDGGEDLENNVSIDGVEPLDLSSPNKV